MFTHCTHSSVKKKIVEQFSSESPLRVLIATGAFGLGMNCPDIHQVVIHWGLPQDAETYVQESGRAGRDGKQAISFIIKQPHDLDRRFTSEQMIEYCQNKSVCRRSILYRDFPPSLYFLLSLQHVFVVMSVGQHVNVEIVTSFNVRLCCESKLYQYQFD